MDTLNKTVGSIIVHRSRIIGTNMVVYSAYEPSSYVGPHSSLMTLDGQTCGSLLSRRLPAEIDAMPVGRARMEACVNFRARNQEEAYTAIVAAFPEAAEGHRSHGEIEVYVK